MVTRAAAPGSPRANQHRVGQPGGSPPPPDRGLVDSLGVLTAPPPQLEALTSSPVSEHVFEGPAWYRVRIRRYGPVLALVAPAILGAIALVVLELTDGTASGVTVLVTGICAAPGLLAFGGPLATSDDRPIGIAVSIAVWLVVGVIAGRVATRNPVASFTDFWRAYRWLALGVFLGSLAALGAASLVVDRSLL